MTETIVMSGDIREREKEQDSKGNIYKVRDIRGVDAPDPPRPLHEYQTFPSWSRASENQFCSKGRWLDMGYVVKTGEESHACVRIERKSAVGVDDTHATDNHRWPAEYFSVYHRTQVRYLKQPQRSRRIVIGRFLGFCDWLGYRRHDGGGIRQLRADSVHGTVKDLVYRSFLYRNRTTGIKVPIAFSIEKEDKNDFVADAFYVRAGELTRYFVLDLDNHRPTRVSTEAHLLLVERLVGLLPELLKEVGGGKVFYDYSQFAPRGIHIWVLLNHRRYTRKLHEAVRKFLVEHSEASLDERLRLGGLPEMGAVEILPTESHLIRFFGAYDRSVFTTRELKPRDNAFDAEALLDHIHDKTKIGDPCGRYGELARAGLAGDGLDAVVPGRATIVPGHSLLLSERPTMRSNPFVVLVDACLNGVTEPDVLFGTYLRPLATALYLRDLHDHPRRESEVVSTLMRWLETKHNGLVSRIGNGETRNLRGVIRHIVKNIGRAPGKVRAFWSSVRSRDRAHPDRKISLVKCMETVLDGPVTVTKENLDQVRRLVQGEEACPCSGNMEIILPGTVEARLRDHLGRAGVAPGKRTDRIVRFAERLIRDIGVKGKRRIPCGRINQLAGLGKGRRHAGRYKRLLTGAGIIEPGSDKTMRVKLKSILYQLTDWVVDEVVREVSSAPVITHRR